MFHVTHLMEFVTKVDNTSHPWQVNSIQLQRGWVLHIVHFPTHVDTLGLGFHTMLQYKLPQPLEVLNKHCETVPEYQMYHCLTNFQRYLLNLLNLESVLIHESSDA